MQEDIPFKDDLPHYPTVQGILIKDVNRLHCNYSDMANSHSSHLKESYGDAIRDNYLRLSKMVQQARDEYNEIITLINEKKNSKEYQELHANLQDIKHSVIKEQKQLTRLTQEREERSKEVEKLKREVEYRVQRNKDLLNSEKYIKRRLTLLRQEFNKRVREYMEHKPHYNPEDLVVGQGKSDFISSLSFFERVKLLFK